MNTKKKKRLIEKERIQKARKSMKRNLKDVFIALSKT